MTIPGRPVQRRDTILRNRDEDRHTSHTDIRQKEWWITDMTDRPYNIMDKNGLTYFYKLPTLLWGQVGYVHV